MIGAILLLGLGLVLVMAEVLFPSFGILSVLATAAFVAAVVLAFRQDQETGVTFVVAIALGAPVMVLAGMKLFPKSPMGRRMIAPGLSFASSASLDPRDLELVGASGTAETNCRPSGVGRLQGRRVSVVTRGEFIAKGEPIQVVEVQGNRVVVARSSETKEPS